MPILFSALESSATQKVALVRDNVIVSTTEAVVGEALKDVVPKHFKALGAVGKIAGKAVVGGATSMLTSEPGSEAWDEDEEKP